MKKEIGSNGKHMYQASLSKTFLTLKCKLFLFADKYD